MSFRDEFSDFRDSSDDESISGKENLMSEDECEHQRRKSVSIDGSASPRSIDSGLSDDDSDMEKKTVPTVSSTAKGAEAHKRLADDEAGSGSVKRFMSRKSVDDEESDDPVVDEQGLDFDAKLAIYERQSQAEKAKRAVQWSTHPLAMTGSLTGLSSLTCPSGQAAPGKDVRQQGRKTTIAVLSGDSSGISDDDVVEVSRPAPKASVVINCYDISSSDGDESDNVVADDRPVAHRRIRRKPRHGRWKSYKEFSSDEADREMEVLQENPDDANPRPRLNLRQKNHELKIRIEFLEDMITELNEKIKDLKRGKIPGQDMRSFEAYGPGF